VARVVEQSGLKALLAWCLFGLGPDKEPGGARLETTREFAARWQGVADAMPILSLLEMGCGGQGPGGQGAVSGVRPLNME
jgi:hypothetical protein